MAFRRWTLQRERKSMSKTLWRGEHRELETAGGRKKAMKMEDRDGYMMKGTHI